MITLMDVVKNLNEGDDREIDRFRRFAARVDSEGVDARPFYAPDRAYASHVYRLIALIFWMSPTERWWQREGRYKFLLDMIDAVRILQYKQSWIRVSASEVGSAFESLAKVEYPLDGGAFCRPFDVRATQQIIGVDDTWAVTVTVPPGGFNFNREMEE